MKEKSTEELACPIKMKQALYSVIILSGVAGCYFLK